MDIDLGDPVLEFVDLAGQCLRNEIQGDRPDAVFTGRYDMHPSHSRWETGRISRSLLIPEYFYDSRMRLLWALSGMSLWKMMLFAGSLLRFRIAIPPGVRRVLF